MSCLPRSSGFKTNAWYFFCMNDRLVSPGEDSLSIYVPLLQRRHVYRCWAHRYLFTRGFLKQRPALKELIFDLLWGVRQLLYTHHIVLLNIQVNTCIVFCSQALIWSILNMRISNSPEFPEAPGGLSLEDWASDESYKYVTEQLPRKMHPDLT